MNSVVGRPLDKQGGPASAATAREEDDFPYRVEIWNSTRTYLQQTVAITISKNVGFASYYAALEQAAEKEAAAWRRQTKRMPMLFSPTIDAAVTALVPGRD